MILDAYGREARVGRPRAGEMGVGGVRLAHTSYPSQGLTPERLAAIFREADAGDVLRQGELFEEMLEKDAHLGSVVQTRRLAVAGLEWEVAAAGGADADEEVAAYVREALAGMGGVSGLVMDLLDAVGKGFSVVEIVWEVDGERARVAGLKWRHQKLFTFVERGGLVGEAPRLLTEVSPVYGEDLPAGKFLVHRGGGRSGLPGRGGLLRPCAWMYLFKNYALKDWVVFAERYAQPLRVGKFGPQATEQDRRVLRDAVFNLGADAAAVISDSTVIEMLGAAERGATADVYLGLVEFCDRAMSKAVLGQTLTSEQAGGTYATARVHDGVRGDLIEADAAAVSATITRDLIRPMVAYNFGPGRGAPVFRLQAVEGEDLRALAETYGVLSAMGVEIPEGHVRKRFGIPGGRVGEAMKSGRIAPAQREWAMGYALGDPEGFEAYVRCAPMAVPVGEVVRAGGPGVGMSPAQQEVNGMLGIGAGDYRRHNAH